MNPKRFLFLFTIAVLFAIVLRLFVFEGVYVATGSMEPTLPVGTHAFSDKLTLRFRALHRGEIVVFTEPVPPHASMIKRVVALSGDTVEIKNKKVWLNGSPVDEPYAQHTRSAERLVGDNLGPLHVPEGQVFLLGDNRDESEDASVWKDASGQPVYFVPLRAVSGLLRGFY